MFKNKVFIIWCFLLIASVIFINTDCLRAQDPDLPGVKISFEFRNAEISTVLALIAKEAKKSFLIGDDVKGAMTLSFKNTPINDAFNTILCNAGLSYSIIGDIIEVHSLAKKKERAKEAVEASRLERQSIEERSALITKAVQLRNALNPRGTISGELPEETGKIKDLEELAKALEKRLSKRKGACITVINRTNTILVTDIPSHVEDIVALIKDLDRPLSQITIEAKITEAISSIAKEMGVAWGGRYKRGEFETSGATGLEEYEANRLRGYGSDGVFDELTAETVPITGNIGLSGENLAVNLLAGVSEGKGGAIGFMIGNIGQDVLDIQLSALESKGDLKVLSAPKIITQDNQRAYIKSGYEIPYREFSETSLGRGEYTVEFKTAAIELEVTPHIVEDEVFLDVVVGKSEPDWSRAIGDNPPLLTRSLTTKVRVKSGETFVIGGLKKDYSTKDYEGVRFLHRIPILGWLFKKKVTSKDNSELMIFITPTIIKEG